MSKIEAPPDNGTKINDIIAGLSLFGIGLYLVLRYGLGIGHSARLTARFGQFLVKS
jgi:hypothetical protein